MDLKKPADLDSHCFQLRLYLFSYCFLKSLCMIISKVRGSSRGSLCIICSLGHVHYGHLLVPG